MGVLALAAVLIATVSSATIPAISRGASAATFPGSNGEILFTRTLGFNPPLSSLVAISSDGTNEHTVAQGTDVREGSWSPDGTKIAFVNTVMNADGTDQHSIGIAYYPSWSPDGTKIAAWIPAAGIAVMGADGSNPTLLTHADSVVAADLAPSWSPDGTKMVFTHEDVATQTRSIMIMDADGSNQTHVVSGDSNALEVASWSPSGQLAVAMENKIWTMNPDGSNKKVLIDTAYNATEPSWSPDGTKIAFRGSFGDRSDCDCIYVANANGSNPTFVASNGYYPSWGTHAASAPPPTTKPKPKPKPPPPPPPPPSVCKDIYFVSARGSGQPFLNSFDSSASPETAAVYDGMTRALKAGKTVEFRQLSYPALSVNVLSDDGVSAQTSLVAAKNRFFQNVNAYLSGEQSGVAELAGYITGVAFTCFPEGKAPTFVLSGYSQGAMVIHDYLAQLVRAGSASTIAKIKGVALIADPERMVNSNVTNLGTAKAKDFGLCRAVDNLPGNASCIPPFTTQDVSPVFANAYDICDKDDLVCDTSSLLSVNTLAGYKVALSLGMNVHTTYKNRPGPSQAGKAIGKRLP